MNKKKVFLLFLSFLVIGNVYAQVGNNINNANPVLPLIQSASVLVSCPKFANNNNNNNRATTYGFIENTERIAYGSNDTFIVTGKDAGFIDMNAKIDTDNTSCIEFKHDDGASAMAKKLIPWNTPLIITQDGKVGINETKPDDMLHVTASNRGTRVRSENTTNRYAGFVSKNLVGEIFVGLQGKGGHTPGEFQIFDNVAKARRMVIDAAGFVGIGKGNPSVKLDVNGSVNCIGGTCSSDIRWKKDIQPLGKVLSKLDQLQGVSYYWRNLEFPYRDFEEAKQIGLIAQEVEAVFPELIKTDEEGYKSMDYMSFTAVLLEGLKTLKKEQEQLQSTVKDLKMQQQTLKDRVSEIDALKAEIELIKQNLQN